VISADKMMNRAEGPVWHKRMKEKGIIPKGTDKEAAWCRSAGDGWVYGYGSFSPASHGVAVPGCFMLMKNSGHEAERMRSETSYHQDVADYTVTDSEADRYGLFRELRRQSGMASVTECRKNKTETEEREKMSLFTDRHKKLYAERSYTAEPMQGSVKDISDLSGCHMKGSISNRRLSAAMGLTVRMYQLTAWRENRPTFEIRDDVSG
jgi:hypothetical protein